MSNAETRVRALYTIVRSGQHDLGVGTPAGIARAAGRPTGPRSTPVDGGVGCIVLTVRLLPLPDPPLSDDAVSLRQFTLDDVPAVTAAMQDREVSRWTATIPWPYHESHAREWIGLHDQQRRAGDGVNFAITTGEGEAAIGAIGIHKFDWVKLGAQVGYWVARQERNRGLATHAALLASQWALTDLGLTHLRLFTIVGNVASERVAAKAGYRVVEVLPDHDLGTKRATVKRWELLHV